MSIQQRGNLKKIVANKESINAICKEHRIKKLYLALEQENKNSSEIIFLATFDASSFSSDDIEAAIDAEIALEKILKVGITIKLDKIDYRGFLRKLMMGVYLVYCEEGYCT
ncbi:hypothetical protein GE107_21495 [Cohnella sp. CFH 77786]|uniref:hypothetical protein n=1 Tax=Cohnella sp. CFH 77786 TaxID=2662265 RepID=UPI001C609CFA|nr:hypothetical protein [Cohnella sp. CFH 77786]MBW5448625.1 hypothetical protein [Cohnella sp. CFH 77786]